ncbi:MAG: hypothetical protein WC959_05250 [Kiritimatiellales bacterium]
MKDEKGTRFNRGFKRMETDLTGKRAEEGSCRAYANKDVAGRCIGKNTLNLEL